MKLISLRGLAFGALPLAALLGGCGGGSTSAPRMPLVTPTATPETTPAPTAQTTATPETTPVPAAEATATPEITPVATTEPTATPEITPVPTAEPTATPSAEPTAMPLPSSTVMALNFDLTPSTETASSATVTAYNNAILGTKSGQLAGNSLTLSSTYSVSSKSGGRGGSIVTITTTTYKFSLSLTGSTTLSAGDVFIVGSNVPAATIRLSRNATNYIAESGQVRVVSKTANALTLQLTDVVVPPSVTGASSTTFNGTITAALA